MKKLITLSIGLGLIVLLATLAQADSAEWLLDPDSGDWNSAANWTSGGPPNGPADTATFAESNRKDVFISEQTEVNGITFTSHETNDPYTITVNPNVVLTISGVGIRNKTATSDVQNFVTAPGGGEIDFRNEATAGFNTHFTNKGATVQGTFGGLTTFSESSTAANGIFTNEGANVIGALGGLTIFRDSSTADNGTFTTNGATVSGAFGGQTIFRDNSTADSATLIANGGTNGGLGGTIRFEGNSQGNTSRVEVFGNGSLDLSEYNGIAFEIGSIEGSGNVVFQRNTIDLTVGGNNRNTEFSGVLDGGADVSLSKEGTGKLTLSGDVDVRETFILSGVLQVNGLVTNDFIDVGSKATLAGTGGITGEVNNIGGGTVSPGTVNPGSAGAPGKLTIGGNYSQSSNATLMIQIAGASDGQFSVLDVGSHAFLDGILKVVLLDDFVPEVDQTFAFLTYFIREGEFSHIANRNFGNIHWDVDFMDSEGFAVLTAKAGNVRAPDQGSTFVLLTLGLLGLVTYRRQLLRRQT
jgi:hypothetical protein